MILYLSLLLRLIILSPGRPLFIMRSSNFTYKAAVIGAGPAGLACVGNLLDRLVPTERILWIDPKFCAGRLDSYPAVPSNTKVCLFTKFAQECRSFGDDDLPILKKLLTDFDGQKGCQLKFVADLCKELTDRIRSNPRVESVKESVGELEYSKDLNVWTIRTEEGTIFQSENVLLATGSQPKELERGRNNSVPVPPSIHLDDALNPDLLKTKICLPEAFYTNSRHALFIFSCIFSISRVANFCLNIVDSLMESTKV